MSYNGWANYQTWNVALWIGGDEKLYNLVRELGITEYKKLAEYLREDCGLIETPDGIAYNDSGIDTSELDEMLRELTGQEVPEE